MRHLWVVVPALLTLACRSDGGGHPRIAVTKFETVSGSQGDGGFEGFTLVSPVLHGGRRIAYQPNPPGGPPLIVDSSGRVIDTLARLGAGPGEVQQMSRVVRGRGDTVYVVDAGRVAVYSPDLRFLRTFPSTLHSAWSAAALPSGEIALATSTYGTPEIVTAYEPGAGTRSWGVTITPDLSSHLSEIRSLAVAPDGTLWTIRVTGSLAFEHFGRDGRRLGGITATPEWYPPYDRMQSPSRTAPPTPSVAGFWVDSAGRAWVVGLAADPKWAEAAGKDQPGEGGTTYFVPDHPENVRDGIIDVIDLTSGRSMMSVRNDVPFGIPIEPWIIERVRTDADGWQQIDLYRVTEGTRP